MATAWEACFGQVPMRSPRINDSSHALQSHCTMVGTRLAVTVIESHVEMTQCLLNE